MAELTLQVIDAKQETPTIYSVTLSLGGRLFPFKPGQYCLMELYVGSQKEAHPLSIASSPLRPHLQFATRQSDSAFKQAFCSLKRGDEVKVSGPFGRFIFEDRMEQAVLLSGGIGITPLKSIIEYVADKSLSNRIILLYGNRTPEEIAFRQELNALAQKRKNIAVVHTISRPEESGQKWTGQTGRIDEALLRNHVPDLSAPTYFICGPPGMVAGLSNLLHQLEIPQERIKVEQFTGYE